MTIRNVQMVINAKPCICIQKISANNIRKIGFVVMGSNVTEHTSIYILKTLQCITIIEILYII